MHEETITQDDVPLRDYLDLLRRRIAIIIQTCIAAFVIGIVIALVSSNVYRSAGRLLVTPPTPQVIRDANDPLIGVGINQVQNIQTQLQVLMNGALLSDSFKAAGVSPGDPRVRVNVSQLQEDVNIIEISCDAHKPDVAEGVVNNLMTLYRKREEQSRNGDIDGAIQFAEQRIKDANNEWKAASLAWQKLQDKTRSLDITETASATSKIAADKGAKASEYDTTLKGLEAQIATMRAQKAKLPPSILKETIQTNPRIEILKNDLVKLINERDAKLELFKPDHPTMKVIYAGIKSLEEQIAKTSPTITITENVTNPEILDTEMKVRALVAQVEALKASKQKNAEQQQQTMASMSALSKFQYDAAVLKQKMELAQGHVKMLEEKLADLRLRRSAAAQPISILEPAVINPIPVKPKRPLIIGAALLAGLFLGICFALLAEYLDDRVNSPDDARRVLGVPALGYIPRVDKEQQRLLTSADASGTLLESYRVLRSNVRFAAVGEPLHSIMVTSTAPGEGKSVTAANLAVAMALDGKKVILVDADLRRPTVHEKFGIRNSPGLTNVLAGTMPLDQTLQASGVENLQILSSGTPPPNPAELLNSRAMEQVQEMLKERADIVIFDSPPCLSVADAQVLAASVDGLIYVVQLGSTRKSALKHGTELLRQAHARILGVVYNKMQMDGRRNDYYYGYYSAYHKKELPGKNGSNGHKREDSEDWNALPVQNQDTPALDETLRPRLNAPSEKEES